MRKALKRAAHVLAAAGALGIVYPAVAQTAASPAKVFTPKPAAGGVVATSAASGEATVTSQGKLEEMQVELALLRNSATFAFPIGCKHTGSTLEVRGFVPSNLVKNQVVEIAKKNCSVAVVDKLQLNGAMMLRAQAGTTDEMQHGGATLLAQAFGSAAVGLEVKAVGQGQIALSGSCESYEQKLAVSRKLRALHGCSSVDNQLTVKAVPRDGRMVTLVTADGSHSVPATGAIAEAPVRTVSTTPFTPSAPPLTTAAVTPKTPVTSPVVASAPSITVAPPVKQELPALKPLRTETPPAAVAMKTEIPAPLVKMPEPPKKIETPAPTLATKVDAPPKLVTTTPLPPVAAPLAPTTSPLAHVSAHAKQPETGWHEKPVEPTPRIPAPVAVKPTPPPASGHWPSAHEARPVQVAYATSGVVLFDDEPLPEPPPLMKNNQAAVIKQKVAAVCGHLAKEVIVETKPDGKLHVLVVSTSKVENDSLTNKVLMLPEMASPNVKLEVRLAR